MRSFRRSKWFTIRIEPPWSPPMAMSTSPMDMRTPQPELDPPDDRVLSYGLPTGPWAAVFETPYAQTFGRF